MKKVVVCGAGGFIGNHLVSQLKKNGCWVLGVDLVHPLFSKSEANEFLIGDLRNQDFVVNLINEPFDELYQLAADMGGAGYIFTGLNDADIMMNSVTINTHILNASRQSSVKKIFFSSSACIYPQGLQTETKDPGLKESFAYPADPDSEYGWEKLFSERLYESHRICHSMDIKIARYHNVFGPYGVYEGGKEKAVSAICRKVALANDGDQVEVWGTGKQMRSFLFIDECIEGTLRLMRSNEYGPFNIGSEEMVSIEDLTKMVIRISGKKLNIKYVDGPVGVNGRNSQNDLIQEKLGWKPSKPLIEGVKLTYKWIEENIGKRKSSD